MAISKSMQKIYDFFKQQYTRNSNVFIGFENIGSVVSSIDYMEATKAQERTCQFVDFMPLIDVESNTLYRSSLRKFSSFYYFLIESIQPINGDMYEPLAEAKAAFANQELASIISIGGKYHPVNTRPEKWYDQSDIMNWQKCTLQLQLQSGESDLVFKKSTTVEALKERLMEKLLEELKGNIPSAHSHYPPGRDERDAAIIRDSPKLTFLDEATDFDDIKNAFPKDLSNYRKIFHEDPTIVDPPMPPIIEINIPQPVTIDISFMFCIVEFERLWFNFDLFNLYTDWYINNVAAGEYALGGVLDKNSDNKRLPVIPVAMIAVKDLHIEGLSSSDIALSQNQSAFGPFSLSGVQTTGARVSCHGMQVIGWITEIMPKCPPQNPV